MPTIIVKHGPLFEPGRAEAEFKHAAQEWADDLAELGNVYWRANMNATFRHQTPYYRTRAHVERMADGAKVTDGGVIYGPWLEGVGSRNRTTRFKGYFNARRTTQQLDKEAVRVGKPVAELLVKRLGG